MFQNGRKNKLRNQTLVGSALKQSGFTLIELIITVVILAILLVIGVPSYQWIMTSMRMSGEIDSLMGDLKFARSEAIKRGLNVLVCPSTDQSTCNGSNWTNGWIVNADTTLHQTSGVSSGDTLTWSVAANPLVTPTGYLTTAAGGGGTFALHNAADDAGQRLCITIAAGAATLNKGATCP